MKFVFVFFILSAVLSAQYKFVFDERTQSNMAVGYGERSVLEDSSFSGWFNKEYAFYHVDEDAFDKLETGLHDLNITIVMGTWCSDSKREVPRFLKILDKLDFPEDAVKLIFVDREKQGLADEVEDLDIELVPTIIFYRDDEKLGRIVEAPYGTLEEDMIAILE